MIEFYLICYNNTFCVEYQIKTIRQFCKDPFNIIIIDSNCGKFPEKSKLTKNICETMDVEMLEIPPELSGENQNATIILGNKLNYVYYEIIKKREPKYFAFLDQDFFMFRPFTIIEFLDKYGMYGDIDEPTKFKSPGFDKDKIIDGPWVLHPWLSFYKYDFVKNENMNWSSSYSEEYGFFDTGGNNWNTFISKKNIDKRTYWFRDEIIMYYPFYNVSHDGPPPYEKQYFAYNNELCYGQLQINGSFIHILNSRILNDPLHPKTCFCKGFLDAAMLLNGAIFDNDNGFQTDNSYCKKLKN